MKTTQTQGGKTPVTNYHANVKSYTAPVIVDHFIDDEGEINYILGNGNTQLADSYNALWNPTKGKMKLDRKYKGEGIDPRSNFY